MATTFELLQWGDAGWGDELAAGAAVTISLALVTLPFGVVAGFVVALGKRSRDPLVRASAGIYTTIFRGVPEFLTLFIVYYGAQFVVSTVGNALVGRSFEISPFLAGVVALGLVLSAYAAEVFVSAFRAIPIGQFEAAQSLGLERTSVMRLVILPQLVRLALPGLSNLWLALLKDTALVSVITLNDLLRQTQVAVSATKQPFLFFFVACLIYLVFSIISSAGIWRIDAWASRGVEK